MGPPAKQEESNQAGGGANEDVAPGPVWVSFWFLSSLTPHPFRRSCEPYHLPFDFLCSMVIGGSSLMKMGGIPSPTWTLKRSWRRRRRYPRQRRLTREAREMEERVVTSGLIVPKTMSSTPTTCSRVSHTLWGHPAQTPSHTYCSCCC